MTVAILSGASSGAIHAVTGPDHLLSLGPAALSSPRAAGRVGLVWGAGHALGTLLLSLPLLLLAQLVHLSSLAAISTRLAGLALLASAAWSWHSSRAPRAAASGTTATVGARSSTFWIGLVHGVTGAGPLLMLLPNALGPSLLQSSLYLSAFAVGSTLAMATLTRTIGQLGHALNASTLRRVEHALFLGAGVLGSVWLIVG
jgi:hypothetical protein